MNNKVYLHSIGNDDYNKQLIRFFDIVKEGKILSKRKQGINDTISFAGLDHISLCDYEKKDLYPDNLKYYNSYNAYVRCGISLAFDKEKIDAINPIYYKFDSSNYYNNVNYMKELGNRKERYSDLLDEVQVKDEINLKDLSYVTFPSKVLFEREFIYTKNKKYKYLKEKIDEINKILNYFKYNSDIYDIDSEIKLDDEGIVKLVYKK